MSRQIKELRRLVVTCGSSIAGPRIRRQQDSLPTIANQTNTNSHGLTLLPRPLQSAARTFSFTIMFLPTSLDRLRRAQDGAARGCARCERVSEPRDDRMSEPFLGHAASDVGNMVCEMSCEIIHALNRGIWIDVQFLGQPA